MRGSVPESGVVGKFCRVTSLCPICVLECKIAVPDPPLAVYSHARVAESILEVSCPAIAKENGLTEKNTSRAGAVEALDRAQNFAAAFFALKRIFAPYVKYLHVNADTRTRFYLETKAPTYKGKPLFFGAVVSGKTYVSFHLMPLYWDESLRNKVSPELKKRMQGLSCFNFSGPDPALFRELSKLAAAGLGLYRRKNLL
jgi:hypothetical protein